MQSRKRQLFNIDSIFNIDIDDYIGIMNIYYNNDNYISFHYNDEDEHFQICCFIYVKNLKNSILILTEYEYENKNEIILENDVYFLDDIHIENGCNQDHYMYLYQILSDLYNNDLT